MHKQQSGFTLIELVVVIVIIGILAATAVPRFTGLTDDANQAVAQGLLGAIQSSAVIQFGQNQGQPVPFASIEAGTAFEAQNTAEVDLDGGASFSTFPSGTETCDPNAADPVQVRYPAGSGGQIATGTIPLGLCAN